MRGTASLIFDFATLVHGVRPKVVMGENVPTLVSRYGEFFESAMDAFRFSSDTRTRAYYASHGVLCASDFGVGYIYDSYYYGDGVHLYADYLWHPTTITSTPSFELPIYIGAGLRFWNFSYCVAKVCTVDGSTFGIRVPFGIAFDFNNVPLDVFIELVPVLDFVRGAYYDRFHDRSHLGIDLSVGNRFWFK